MVPLPLVKLLPPPGWNSGRGSAPALHTAKGFGVWSALSAPSVMKLSNSNSGNAPNASVSMPEAFQDVLASLLNHIPDVLSMTKGFKLLPATE